MKKIKIFLASSEELDDDRQAFGNLVRRLDMIYEKRGIRVELFGWEDGDAAYNGCSKQVEYDEKIKASDLFLALFHIRAGKYTVHEFDVANEQLREKGAPKIYVYCKDLRPGEEESQNLKDFKKRLFDELGHYWCRYGNRDTMQLHFVMQLLLVENDRMDSLKVEDNGNVTIDGIMIACMDNLPFAACNEAYRKMSAELQALSDDIEKARQHIEEHQDDKDLLDELKMKYNRYNLLKEEFVKLQQNLISTAKTIANLKQQQVNARLRRAMEAFEAGNLKLANTLLEENEREGDLLVEQLDRDHKRLHEIIDSLLLETKTVMADVTIPIAERIIRAHNLYLKADDWAIRSAYGKEKFAKLLLAYADFLRDYALYDEAIIIFERQRILSEELYGHNSVDIAKSYSRIGEVYYLQGDYDNALKFFVKAITIDEDVLGTGHILTATDYNNIGGVYIALGDYDKALEYLLNGVDIYKNVLGEKHPQVAGTYNNIGLVYLNQGKYTQALEYLKEALKIDERAMGSEHPSLARTYNNIGAIYSKICDYDKALECYSKALEIQEKVLGSEHPDIAMSYFNIGGVFITLGDYDKALSYNRQALAIREKVLGLAHHDTAMSYNCIGGIYYEQGDLDEAMKCYFLALGIDKKVLGLVHPEVADIHSNIGMVFSDKGDDDQALKHYRQALAIREQVLGPEHLDTANSYHLISVIYYNNGEHDEALKYAFKALEIREKVLGQENLEIAKSYVNIGAAYYNYGDYSKALEYYCKVLSIREKVLGAEHLSTATSYNDVGLAYDMLDNNAGALENYLKAYAIYEKTLGGDDPRTIMVRENIERVKEAMVQESHSESPQSEKSLQDGWWSRLFGGKKKR